MKKNSIKYIVAIILLAVTALALVGCSGTEKSVSSIAIAKGSFKEVYALDEVPDFTNAQIVVTYTDGSVANVPITAEMVSGLSTSVSVSGAKLTVTYKGITATFLYKVEGTVNVKTPVRIVATATTENDLEYVITVKMKGIEQEPNGVYAVGFTVASVGDISIGDMELVSETDCVIKTNRYSGGKMSVIIYSRNGYDSFVENGDVVRFTVTKTAKSGTVNIESISISDGTENKTVPGTTIKLS